jgi:exonuclease III
MQWTEFINQMVLTDIHRNFYPKTKEYTFFQHLMKPSPKLII